MAEPQSNSTWGMLLLIPLFFLLVFYWQEICEWLYYFASFIRR